MNNANFYVQPRLIKKGGEESKTPPQVVKKSIEKYAWGDGKKLVSVYIPFEQFPTPPSEEDISVVRALCFPPSFTD